MLGRGREQYGPGGGRQDEGGEWVDQVGGSHRLGLAWFEYTFGMNFGKKIGGNWTNCTILLFLHGIFEYIF